MYTRYKKLDVTKSNAEYQVHDRHTLTTDFTLNKFLADVRLAPAMMCATRYVTAHDTAVVVVLTLPSTIKPENIK